MPGWAVPAHHLPRPAISSLSSRDNALETPTPGTACFAAQETAVGADRAHSDTIFPTEPPSISCGLTFNQTFGNYR
jgi:hypothetical protein